MNTQMEKLIRNCIVCGKRIVIALYRDRTYEGGHFFGKLNIAKRKKAEYWECNRCFANNSNVS